MSCNKRFLMIRNIFILSTYFIFMTTFLSATLSTYFSYSPSDLKKLESLRSSYILSKKDLEQSDEMILMATSGEPQSAIEIMRLCTYLYVAQLEAMKISHYVTGSYSGSLIPLT